MYQYIMHVQKKQMYIINDLFLFFIMSDFGGCFSAGLDMPLSGYMTTCMSMGILVTLAVFLTRT